MGKSMGREKCLGIEGSDASRVNDAPLVAEVKPSPRRHLATVPPLSSRVTTDPASPSGYARAFGSSVTGEPFSSVLV